MKRHFHLATISLLVAILSASTAQAQSKPAVPREISNVQGPLFRFRSNEHHGVFLVDPQGVAIVDPIDRDTALWLKEEIGERYNVPVRYVIYSSDRADHIGGAEVFADSAVIVASAAVRESILRNHSKIKAPQVTFDDDMVVRLVARSPDILSRAQPDIVLSIRRPSDGAGAAVVYFPKQHAAYVGDLAFIRQLPKGDFKYFYVDQWLETLSELAERNVVTVIPAHGDVGTGADLIEFRNYLRELRDSVFEQILAGHNLRQAKREVKLTRYEDWSGYRDQLPKNIGGMYRFITNFYRTMD